MCGYFGDFRRAYSASLRSDDFGGGGGPQNSGGGGGANVGDTNGHTGKGIPKNQFKQIFDPGFTTKKRGWGLGLSLTKRIVETYHKGKIRVYQSEVNKGTTMLLELPLA